MGIGGRAGVTVQGVLKGKLYAGNGRGEGQLVGRGKQGWRGKVGVGNLG